MGCWPSGISRVTVTRTEISPVSSVVSWLIEYNQPGSAGSSATLLESKEALSTVSGGVAWATISAILLSARSCARARSRAAAAFRSARTADLAQGGHRPGQDGQGQNHLQQGKAAAGLLFRACEGRSASPEGASVHPAKGEALGYGHAKIFSLGPKARQFARRRARLRALAHPTGLSVWNGAFATVRSIDSLLLV